MNNDAKTIVISNGGIEIILILQVKNWTTFLTDTIRNAKIKFYDDDDAYHNYSLQEWILDSLTAAEYEYEVIGGEAQEVIL